MHTHAVLLLRFVNCKMRTCTSTHWQSKKINNINNKTHSTLWFASFSMSEFSSYTRCVGCGCCCCCSCSCYVFFFRFFVLRFGMAFIFLFVFSYLCENAALVCVVTLPPFWHSQQQREQYHSKRAARQLSKFENERESAAHRIQPNTDTNTFSLKESEESERDNMHKY